MLKDIPAKCCKCLYDLISSAFLYEVLKLIPILSEILNSKPIPPNAVSETSNEGKIPFFSTPS